MPQRLRAGFLTPSLLLGGAERWMISLARHSDPRMIEWTGAELLYGEAAAAHLLDEMVQLMPVCSRAGNRLRASHGRPPHRSPKPGTVSPALRNADALVTWGISEPGRHLMGFAGQVVVVSHASIPLSNVPGPRPDSGTVHFAAVSQAATQAFRPEARAEARVLHNGVELERCRSTRSRGDVRAEWGFQDHHRLIGHLGRFARHKNPLAPARAAARLGDDYHAVYVGAGEREDEVRTAVHAIAGSRSHFTGPVHHVGDALGAMDVFMLASPAEGFSLALAEAWCCGVPVVATRVGAIPELERRHGQLVAPVPVDPTPHQLADAVELALTPEFRSRVVSNARRTVLHRYTAAHMAARWTSYLYEITGRTADA